MISITMSMDGHDIAQEIRMERQALKDVSFLLLEGATDIKRFTRYVDEAACSVVNCYGRPNAIEAIELLYDEGFAGALAILDADFDRLTGKLNLHEGIIYSEAHDLDLDWANPDVVRRYLAEVGDKVKCSSHGSTEAIMTRIFNALKPISAARLLNQQGHIHYKLSDIDITACFVNFTVDVDAYVALVFGGRAVSDATRIALKQRILAAASKNYDLLQLTNGHDFHCALGICLRAELGSRAIAQTWGKEVETHLRLAFDNANFLALSLVQATRKWAHENSPFRILLTDLT